jgi:hypothetical protein
VITKTVSASKSTYISTAADRLAVGHVLAFADALREASVPSDELVNHSTSNSTLHLIGLSVRWNETLEVDE